MGFLIVFLGGGIGAALRHGVNLGWPDGSAPAFRYATMIENVSGSLVMGLLVGYFAFNGGVSQHWRLFLTTGHSRRLHDLLGFLARYRAALRARRARARGALRHSVGRTLDRRPLRGAGAGAAFHLNGEHTMMTDLAVAAFGRRCCCG